MHSLLFLITAFSVGLALDLFQDPVGPVDNSQINEVSILNGNDPMSNPDAFNLLFNSQMPKVYSIVPEASNHDPVLIPDGQPLIANWGITEAYNNNPVPERPIPFDSSTPIVSVDETLDSNNDLVPNGSDNIISNSDGGCALDDATAGETLPKCDASCPTNVFYHKRKGQFTASYGSRKIQEEINDAIARRDHTWYGKRFELGGVRPKVSSDFESVCAKLTATLNLFAMRKVERFIPLCCLGPSVLLDPPETIFVPSPTNVNPISYVVTDEENCDFYYEGLRP
ncbi:hypothetical protein MMC29_007810, partial [Sticta canariensis]|nr:hypothetical protein [Sticta canariensis]